MLDGTAVQKIAKLGGRPFEINGLIVRPDDWTVVDPAAMVKPGPQAQPLAVSTLGALRDYLLANRDALDLTKIVVHVASPAFVNVLGPLDARARVREVFLTAATADLTVGFLERFMTLEEFIIGAQVRFHGGYDRGRLLSLLSNVKHETVKTSLDDGVTQVVQARSGVALVSDVAVPNPVHLAGFRTFRDVEQVPSFFVLRVQPGRSGGLPDVGLFEADGGAWRLEAIQRVKEWLTVAVPGVSVLG